MEGELQQFECSIEQRLDGRRWRAKEEVPVLAFGRAPQAQLHVASEIAKGARAAAAEGRRYALGLGVGSGVAGLCEKLKEEQSAGNLPLEIVDVYILAEFYPIEPTRMQSWRRFVEAHLLDNSSNLTPRIISFDAYVAESEVSASLDQYSAELNRCNMQLDAVVAELEGKGRVLFMDSVSRSITPGAVELVEIDHAVRQAYSSAFFGFKNVSFKAMTVTWSVFAQAKSVFLFAFGESIAKTVLSVSEGPTSPLCPASNLRGQSQAQIVCDEASSARLTRFDAPWLLPHINIRFDDYLERKAVIWLSLLVGRPILRLTPNDYEMNHLGQLLRQCGSAYDINVRVYRKISSTITGWPGGKPNGSDDCRKRIVVFSPHPDDDVISMGGTFARLAQQNHEVHVCYQTSGNYAVRDMDVLQALDFAVGVFEALGSNPNDLISIARDRVEADIRSRSPGLSDSSEILRLKALVRRSEARSAALYCGLAGENIHFLNLPFYETGTLKKKPLSNEDVEIVRERLLTIRPHQIYAAGDLSDPHGTHRVCLDAVFKAFIQLQDSGTRC